MLGMNFHHSNQSFTALAPETLNDSAQSGPAIVDPWRRGKAMTYILNGGALVAGGTLTVAVEGRLRSDGATWEAIKEADGATALAFTPALLVDGAQLDGGVVNGTIPFSKIDGETYEALRLVATAAGTQNMPVSAVAVLHQFYERPSGDTDDLLEKLRSDFD